MKQSNEDMIKNLELELIYLRNEASIYSYHIAKSNKKSLEYDDLSMKFDVLMCNAELIKKEIKSLKGETETSAIYKKIMDRLLNRII